MAEGQAGLAFLGPIPWASPILIRIPGLMKSFSIWVKWSEQQVEDRRAVSVPVEGLWHLNDTNRSLKTVDGDGRARRDVSSTRSIPGRNDSNRKKR
jgi:hypothetical protein